MITVVEADKIVASSIREILYPLAKRRCRIDECIHQILAEDIFSDRPLPPFDRVAMDGIAISQLAINNVGFHIEGIQAAGAPKLTLKNTNNCIEVMTGAILPEGCDIVIPYEQVSINENKATLEIGNTELAIFQNIHKRGADCPQGELLLTKGKKITSPDIAVIASVGIFEVEVFDLPKVAVVSTGDELVSVDKEPLEHQIRMSNCYAIKNELQNFGFECVDTFHFDDDKVELKSKIASLVEEYSLLILSGGVSMGKFDYTPEVLDSIGVKKLFHKVKQRPGKPIWFGAKQGSCVVAGLPGNPVSCLVSLRKYIVNHFFAKGDKPTTQGVLLENVSFTKDMTMFCPVKIENSSGLRKCRPIKMNGSGDFLSLSLSDGFLELPQNVDQHMAGMEYPLYLWGSLK